MRRAPIPLFALALVAAGCTGGSEGTTTTGDETTSTTASADTTTTVADTTTTTAPATTTTTGGASDGGGPDCLIGTWVLDNDAFVGALLDEFEASGMDAESLEPNDGTYTVELSPDGTFTGTRDDWGFAVTMTEGTFNVTVDGTETGTWSANEDTMSVSSTDSDMTVSATIEAGGQVQELPDSPVNVPEAIETESDYTCDEDTLEVTSEGVTTVMTRA